jgi:hypothetical protein
MQNMENNISATTKTGAHNPGSFRVVHNNLSLLRIILLIGILIISLILVIG